MISVLSIPALRHDGVGGDILFKHTAVRTRCLAELLLSPVVESFAVPPILSIFLTSVWLLVIVGIATVDDVYHKLNLVRRPCIFADFGVSAPPIIIFSVLTLYYLGYFLLVAYIGFALLKYFKGNSYGYVCGSCGGAE